MTDYPKALAAARECLDNEGHRATDALRDLLAALDAARGEALAWQYRFATPDGLTWSDWQPIPSEAMARQTVDTFGKMGTRAEWRSLKVFEWGGYAGEFTEADFVTTAPEGRYSVGLVADGTGHCILLDGMEIGGQWSGNDAETIVRALNAAQQPAALAVPAGYVPVSALIEAREEVESWAAYATPYFQDKHDLAEVLAKIDGQIAAAQAQQPAAAVPEVPAFTTGHCDYHKQAGGCPLHNLSCGWPKCDQRPNEAHRAMLAAALAERNKEGG